MTQIHPKIKLGIITTIHGIEQEGNKGPLRFCPNPKLYNRF